MVRLCLWIGPHQKYKKKTHSETNIAYYHPRNDKFSRWVYGIDLIEKLIAEYPEVNWIKLDGKADMKIIYPMLDGYLRPNRHDGFPRMVQECKLNGIAIYWSEDGKSKLDEMRMFVDSIKSGEPDRVTQSARAKELRIEQDA